MNAEEEVRPPPPDAWRTTTTSLHAFAGELEDMFLSGCFDDNNTEWIECQVQGDVGCVWVRVEGDVLWLCTPAATERLRLDLGEGRAGLQGALDC